MDEAVDGRSEVPDSPPLIGRLARAISGQPEDFSDVASTVLRNLATENVVTALLALRYRKGHVTGLKAALGDQLLIHEKALSLVDVDQRRQATKLLSLLSASGLDALILKGLTVAMLYYPESHARQRVDLDVFIRQSQEPKIRQVLINAGYTLNWHTRNPVTSHQFTATAPPPTMRPVVFDIHRRISNRAAFSRLMPFETLWIRRQPIKSLHPAAFAPAGPHLLIHACLHRLAHGRGREAGRLGWLYDLHLLLGALTAKEQTLFVDESIAMGVGAICAAALAECQTMFGTSLPDGLLKTLRRREEQEPSAKLLDAGRLAWLWSDFSGQDNTADKLGFLKETLLNQVRRETQR